MSIRLQGRIIRHFANVVTHKLKLNYISYPVNISNINPVDCITYNVKLNSDIAILNFYIKYFLFNNEIMYSILQISSDFLFGTSLNLCI